VGGWVGGWMGWWVAIFPLQLPLFSSSLASMTLKIVYGYYIKSYDQFKFENWKKLRT